PLALPSFPTRRSSDLAGPMTAEDLATMKRLGSPEISPDEKWAAFGVTETDPKSYERATALYLLDLTKPSAVPVRIADKAGASEHSPAFSADGNRIYYLSDASKSEQLWQVTISADGKAGEPV